MSHGIIDRKGLRCTEAHSEVVGYVSLVSRTGLFDRTDWDLTRAALEAKQPTHSYELSPMSQHQTSEFPDHTDCHTRRQRRAFSRSRWPKGTGEKRMFFSVYVRRSRCDNYCGSDMSEKNAPKWNKPCPWTKLGVISKLLQGILRPRNALIVVSTWLFFWKWCFEGNGYRIGCWLTA